MLLKWPKIWMHYLIDLLLRLMFILLKYEVWSIKIWTGFIILRISRISYSQYAFSTMQNYANFAMYTEFSVAFTLDYCNVPIYIRTISHYFQAGKLMQTKLTGLITSCKEMMSMRKVVDTLMQKCESIADRMSGVISQVSTAWTQPL